MPTPPLPDKLDRSFDKWKSPTRGYANRDPLLVYDLFVEMQPRPDPDKLALWSLLRHLLDILGDHRVKLTTLLESTSKAFRTGLPWRTRTHRVELEAPLSWFCDPGPWSQLRPIFEPMWAMEAYRGGGTGRHRVWALEFWSSLWPAAPATLELELKTRHIPGKTLRDLPLITEQFFRNAHAANAIYGNGGIFREVLNRSWPYTRSGQFAYLWRDSPRLSGTLVPWVYEINFFDAARTRHMGPPPRKRDDTDLHVTVPMGEACLIRPRKIDDYEVGPDRYRYRCDGPDCDNVDLLARLMAAKMLVVQHLDALHEQWDRRDAEYERKAALRKKQAFKPRRSIESWLSSLRTRPPRFLQDRAEPDLSTLSRALAEHIHPRTTRFLIRRPDDPRPLAVFGASSRDTTTLHGPLLFGSAKRERAAAAFNPAKDGYDGELSGADADDTPRRLKQFACPRCDGRSFNLRAALEYPDDLDDLEESHRARAEDFFTWLWIIGRCPACAWEGIIADHECA